MNIEDDVVQVSHERIDRMVERLAADSRIVAAYLLGSVLKPNFRRDSDIDLGILVATGRKVSPMEQLELASDLSIVLGHPVHIGLLNTQNLIYAKEAIIEGVCIYRGDTGARDLFAATALSLYLQLKQERREVEKVYAAE